jgi:hypothetical protein
VAVCPGSYRGGPHSDNGIQEWYGVNVGITQRFNGTPTDRITQSVYLRELTGLEAVSRKVLLALHRNYAVMAAANAIIQTEAGVGATIFGFITPLEWETITVPPDIKTGDWFWSSNENDLSRPCGLFVNVIFGNAHRPQHLDAMR